MAKQLENKVVVVTGASDGIGRSIAEVFGAEGAKVVLAARRGGILAEVANNIRAAGGKAISLPTDVTKEGQVNALFTETLQHHGRIDIVVNNAGVASTINTEDITLEYWNQVLDINITAAFLCSREAIRVMRNQVPQGGRIINIGSISSKTPLPNSLPYTTSKFAIQGMTHQLSLDGRRYNISASAVLPGATLSSFTRRRGRSRSGSGKTPEDYIMAPEDVARVVLLMVTLPPEVNLYEAVIFPNHAKSFLGRG